MTKPLTHLEAFCSDEAKRGRKWTDGKDNFKRIDGDLYIDEDRLGNLRGYDEQVAAMEGAVTWADEPKTLTPQEALRALADGKCVSNGSNTWRLCTTREGGMMERIYPDKTWVPATLGSFRNLFVTPDPSRPAEPDDEWPDIVITKRPPKPTKPPLKVGDRVKRRGHEHKGVGCVIKVRPNARDGFIEIQWDEGVGSYPNDSGFVLVEAEPATYSCNNCKDEGGWYGGHPAGDDFTECSECSKEAEPQVEFPLSYVDAMRASHEGAMMACDRYPGILFRYRNDREEAKCVHGCKGWHEGWGLGPGDQDSRWRIVEPATGGEG